MYSNILLPIDGSRGSDRATDFALNLAEQYGATIHGLHVIDTRMMSEPALSSMELVTDEAEAHAADMLEEVSTACEERGVECTSSCCHGTPHEEIIRYAEEVQADVIVMGYQGQSHEQRIGSVVERVLRDTDRPVLAV